MSEALFLGDRFLEPGEQPVVSLFDRGYLLGDSVFETLRAEGGVPFRLTRHLERLEAAARAIELELPRGRAELAGIVREAALRSGLPQAYLRVTVSRGEGMGPVRPEGCGRPLLSVIARPLRAYPAQAYERGIDSMVLETRRIPAVCLPAIKSGSYLGSILAQLELGRRGRIEGVVLTVDGLVSGGSVSNVFLVSGSRLSTPSLESGACRPGVTREAVLELAPQVGLEPAEEPLRPEDLLAADEVFFTNTLMRCLPVARLDGVVLGRGPGGATRRLHEALCVLEAREARAPQS
jgi:branched-chain amino acid aminotransferase